MSPSPAEQRRRYAWRLACALTLILSGLALAGPPAGRWIARLHQDWRGGHQWEELAGAGCPPRPGDPVARLVIPGVDLAWNVLPGASAKNLDHAPILDLEHGSPSSRVVMAHRDTHFNALKQLEVGMAVTWRTRIARHEYRVTDIEIHTPESLEDRLRGLREDDAVLLVTCHPFHHIGPAPGRFLAICHPDAGS